MLWYYNCRVESPSPGAQFIRVSERLIKTKIELTGMVEGRVETTLFMLMSVDGKISTGDNDQRDVDKDFPKIPGVKEGLHQYYDLEQRTDLHSLNTGRVQAKIGVNKKRKQVDKLPVSFIIIDNKPHLNSTGVDYFVKRSKKFYLVTTNKNHPAFKREGVENLEVIYYSRKVDFKDLFSKLKHTYEVDT